MSVVESVCMYLVMYLWSEVLAFGCVAVMLCCRDVTFCCCVVVTCVCGVVSLCCRVLLL